MPALEFALPNPPFLGRCSWGPSPPTSDQRPRGERSFRTSGSGAHRPRRRPASSLLAWMSSAWGPVNYQAGLQRGTWDREEGVWVGDFEEWSGGTGPEAGPVPPPLLSDSVEDEFELSTVCHRPEGLEQLQEQTKFTRKELQVLYRGFKNVSGRRRPTGQGVKQKRPSPSVTFQKIWPALSSAAKGRQDWRRNS
jgi:hypothetical protein